MKIDTGLPESRRAQLDVGQGYWKTGPIAQALILALVCVLTTGAGAQENKGQKMNDTYQGYSAGKFKSMPYRWMKPINYDKTKAYPLVLSLHGRAGVGTDNKRNLLGWNKRIMNQKSWREKYPCFVVAPQNTFAWVRPKTVKASVKAKGGDAFVSKLPRRTKGFVRTQLGKPDYSSLEIVFDLIKKFQKDFNIDASRIYIIGNSMGGYGTWAAMQEEPHLFAAGIPLCGGPYIHLPLERIKHVPVWAFHGTKDKNVPYTLSQGAFEKLKKLGGNCKFTSLKGLGHSVWRRAFTYTGDKDGHVTQYSSDLCDKESNTWKWLFKQRKKAAQKGKQ